MPDYQQFEAHIKTSMAAHQVPGLSLAVVREGRIEYAQGFGVTSAELENALPVTADTLFRAGSVTKPLTGTMLMRLVEQGALNLDVPITQYAPDIRFSVADVAEQVTLRMLLSHTAGLPSDLEYHDRRTSKPYKTDLEQYIREKIPQYPMVAPPGKLYFYSNPGINLAAHLAEVVTGKAYPQLMWELLFEPLGMYRTTFDLAQAITYPLAQGHVLDADGTAQVKLPYIDNPAEYPCGFAMTSANDVAQFMLFHLQNTPIMQEMHRVQVDRLNGDGYGLTFRISTYKGLRTVGHNGAIGKFGAIMRLLPEQQFGVAMLFNRAPGFWAAAGELCNRLTDEALMLSSVKPHDKTAYPANCEGTYLGYEVGLVQIVAGQVTINGKPTDSAVIRRIDHEYIMVDGFACQRFDAARYQIETDQLSDYCGRYSADIDDWTVQVKGDQLSIYSEDDRVEVVCIRLSATRFACDFGVIDFILQAGQVIELVNALGYRFKRVA